MGAAVSDSRGLYLRGRGLWELDKAAHQSRGLAIENDFLILAGVFREQKAIAELAWIEPSIIMHRGGGASQVP